MTALYIRSRIFASLAVHQKSIQQYPILRSIHTSDEVKCPFSQAYCSLVKCNKINADGLRDMQHCVATTDDTAAAKIWGSLVENEADPELSNQLRAPVFFVVPYAVSMML